MIAPIDLMPHWTYLISAVPNFEATALEDYNGLCYCRDSLPEYNYLDLSSETIFMYPFRIMTMLRTEGCTPSQPDAYSSTPCKPSIAEVGIDDFGGRIGEKLMSN